MPVFEIEVGGKTYEVEAPNAEAAASAARKIRPAAPARVDRMPQMGAVSAEQARVGLAGVPSPILGVAQKVAGVGEGAGVLPEGATAAVTGAGRAVQEAIQGKPEEALTPDERAIKGGVSTAVELALPIKGASLVKVGKALKTTIAAGTAGAFGAATHFDPDVEKAWESNLGLAAGTGLGIILGPLAMLPPTLKNWATDILRSPPTPTTAKILRELRQSNVWKSAEKRLTLGQSTGDPRIEIQEARVQARRANSVYNQQVETAERNFNKVLAKVGGPTERAPADLAVELREALNKDRIARGNLRNNEYGSAIDEAEAIAKQDPADAMGVKTDNFATTLRDYKVSREQWQVLADSAPPKYRRAVEEALGMLERNGGRMQLGDMMKVHQALNTMRRGLTRAEKSGASLTGPAADMNRMGRDLQDALQRDMTYMDDVVTKAKQAFVNQPVPEGLQWFDLPGVQYQAAWDKFRAARANFAESMSKEQFIEAQVIEKQFGFQPDKPDEAFRVLLTAPKQDQIRMIDTLSKHFPDTLRDIKAWKLQDAMERAFRQQAAGTQHVLKADAMIKEIALGENEVAGRMMWSPEEMQDIKSGIAYMRLIQSRSALKDAGIEPQRLFMAGISQSAPFLAGAAYKLKANPKLEKWFFTAKGREMLKALATANPNTPAFAAALGYASSLTADELAE